MAFCEKWRELLVNQKDWKRRMLKDLQKKNLCLLHCIIVDVKVQTSQWERSEVRHMFYNYIASD